MGPLPNKPIALIPARSGSQRIPGKNIRLFRGKPLISYSIQAALDSKLFERVVVSTDSDAIAAVAKEHGAEVPFLRPTALADAHTPLAEVLRQGLEWIAQNENRTYDYAALILATAPLLSPDQLRKGYDLIREKRAGSVIPVTTFPYPIQRALKVQDNDGTLSFVWPEHEWTRSNDLPETVHDAGQFYWLDCVRFLQERKLLTPPSVPLPIPRYQVQDIDSEEDWTSAEQLYALERDKT
jgi:pseudaminic acid cytidylyltransferase